MHPIFIGECRLHNFASPVQFFAQIVLSALRDVDILTVHVEREFKFGGADLLRNHKAMERFIACKTKTSRATWSKNNAEEWEDVHESIEMALAALDLVGARSRRQGLLDAGVLACFSSQYRISARPPESVPKSDFRDITSTGHVRRMVAYTSKLVESVERTLHLNSREIDPTCWEAQIRSKIIFLTSSRKGRSPRPFLCVEMLGDIEEQLAKVPDALMEVSRFLFLRTYPALC